MAKIFILGTAYPFRGGIAAFNERLARAFQQENHQVEIITFSLQYPDFLFPGKSQYSEETKPLDLKISQLVNSINPINWIRIGKKIKKIQPDYLIIKFWLPFMAPCLGTIARIVRSNHHTKVIAIIDNIIPHEKRPGDYLLAKYFTGSCDTYIVMSKTVLNDLKKLTSKKSFKLIPHPIYDNFGERISKENAKINLKISNVNNVILFFGFIRKYKGLDLLLEAMCDERIREKKIHLLVAGEFYENRDIYDNIISNNQLDTSVLMHTDFIPDEDVKNYFCSADIVVQPYRTATQSGITQMAYHFERPMIVTNVGGLSEMVPNGIAGYVVLPDKNSIADAIIDYYENTREEFFVKNIRVEKKKFTWQKLINGILD